MSPVNTKLNQQISPTLNTDGITDELTRQNFENLRKFLTKVSQRTNPPAANIVFGPALLSASYTYSAGAIQTVNGMSVQITSKGNPIAVKLMPSLTSVNATYWPNVELLSLTSSIAQGAFGFYRNGTRLPPMSFNFSASGSTNLKQSLSFPCFEIVDPQPAGTYTYQGYVILTDTNSRWSFATVALMAQELN